MMTVGQELQAYVLKHGDMCLQCGRAVLAPAAPAAAVAKLIARLQDYYKFECGGGPLKNCVEWQQLIVILRQILEKDNK